MSETQVRNQEQQALNVASSADTPASGVAASNAKRIGITREQIAAYHKAKADIEKQVFTNNVDVKTKKRTFINLVGPLAQEENRIHGIPAAVIISQGALESGWGVSAMKAHALFGVTAGRNYQGNTVTANTREVTGGGQSYYQDRKFRAYDTYHDSIKDHSQVLLNPNYKGYVEAMTRHKDDSEAFLRSIAKNYATSQNEKDPKKRYDAQCISILRANNLNAWNVQQIPGYRGIDNMTPEELETFVVDSPGFVNRSAQVTEQNAQSAPAQNTQSAPAQNTQSAPETTSPTTAAATSSGSLSDLIRTLGATTNQHLINHFLKGRNWGEGSAMARSYGLNLNTLVKYKNAAAGTQTSANASNNSATNANASNNSATNANASNNSATSGQENIPNLSAYVQGLQNGAPVEKDTLFRFLKEKGTVSAEEISVIRSAVALVEDKTLRGDMYEEIQKYTPYHNQRNNTSKAVTQYDVSQGRKDANKNVGGVMCNLTSLAMCLEAIGISNPDPSMQFEDYLEKQLNEKVNENRGLRGGSGKNVHARVSHEAWRRLAALYGVKTSPQHMLGSESRTPEFWLNTIRPELRSGNSVLLSVRGHIVRVQNVTEEGVCADDPFGKTVFGKGKKNNRSYAATNAPNTEDGKGVVGNNIFWSWDDLKQSNLYYYLVFSR